MTNQILYILIAINCVLFIANVLNALKLSALIKKMKQTRQNLDAWASVGVYPADSLYVRGVDVSDQFPHKAYGLRQDGSIGSDEEDNLVVGEIRQ